MKTSRWDPSKLTFRKVFTGGQRAILSKYALKCVNLLGSQRLASTCRLLRSRIFLSVQSSFSFVRTEKNLPQKQCVQTSHCNPSETTHYNECVDSLLFIFCLISYIAIGGLRLEVTTNTYCQRYQLFCQQIVMLSPQ